MGKKYVPSGYQIIAIKLNIDEDVGTTIEESDDSKLLKELLKEHSKKPILLDVTASTGQHLIGFGCLRIQNNDVVLDSDPYIVSIQYVEDTDELSAAFSY